MDTASPQPSRRYVPNAAQSPATLHWISLFFTLIFGVASIVAILPLLKYELHEHRYAEIIAKLNHRRASTTDPLATDPLGHGAIIT
jgi:Na+/melibiose symporter-like transporter